MLNLFCKQNINISPIRGIYIPVEKVYTNRQLLQCEYYIINETRFVASLRQLDFTTSMSVLRTYFESIICNDSGNTKPKLAIPVPLGCFFVPSGPIPKNCIAFDYFSTGLHIESYGLRLTCSKKIANISDKITRKQRQSRKKRKRRTASDSEDSSDLDLDNLDDGFDADLAFEEFKEGLSDLAEEAERAGRLAFQGDDVNDTLALSMTEIAYACDKEVVDHEQDAVDQSVLDGGSIDHEGGMSSPSNSLRRDMELMHDAEVKRLKDAVRSSKLDISSNTGIQETIEKLQGDGMSLEDATLEAALNSSDVMGNISSQSSYVQRSLV